MATCTWAQAPAQPPDDGPPAMNPAVSAMMATNPTTPAEKVRAAKILSGLGRPDLARQLLGQVLAANLDQPQLFALEQHFSSPLFLRFSLQEELAPEGKQLADAVLQAAGAVLRDSTRLENLVGQLASPDLDTRLAALEGLLQGGRVSIGVLIAALADAGRADEHEMIRSALVEFGRSAVGPLQAALESDNPALRAEAVHALVNLGARQAMPFFLALAVDSEADDALRTKAQHGLASFGRPLPDRATAAAMLVDEAQQYLAGRRHLREDLEGNVTVWNWDAAAGRPASQPRPKREARIALAARLAGDAYRLDPTNDSVRLLYLTTLLEDAARSAGLENRLPITADSPAGLAATEGLETVEQVLLHAMRQDHVGAAVAAVRILEERGSVVSQLRGAPAGTPLIEAVGHDDPRLRFAALEAVVSLDPNTPFNGSAKVVEAVCHFATSQGQSKALVAGPSTSESQRLAGYLAGLDYIVDTARSGRELVELAQRSADYELVLADHGLQKSTVDFVLQQLRHDNRTAGLPVGVLARAGRLPLAEHAVRRDPLALAFPRPHGPDVVQWQVAQVVALSDAERVQPERRLEQASQAMKWLADWSHGHAAFRLPRSIDSVPEALFVPELAPQATTILANTGTPEAQLALVELASRWTQPLPRRKGAVEALWDNTAGNGILLTSTEILRQYDRYNKSQTLDPASQQVLSSILNCLEAPAKVRQQPKPIEASRDDSATAEVPAEES